MNQIVPIADVNGFVDCVTRKDPPAEPLFSDWLDVLLRFSGEPVDAIGLVYFLGPDEGHIKIGFTRDLRARLQNLQAQSPLPLSVHATIYGSTRTEAAYHREFASDRLHGEWFKRSPRLLGTIQEAKRQMKGCRNLRAARQEAGL